MCRTKNHRRVWDCVGNRYKRLQWRIDIFNDLGYQREQASQESLCYVILSSSSSEEQNGSASLTLSQITQTSAREGF
jgi:hypothetical protein